MLRNICRALSKIPIVVLLYASLRQVAYLLQLPSLVFPNLTSSLSLLTSRANPPLCISIFAVNECTFVQASQ